MPLLLAAPDKFRGSATGREVADAMTAAAAECGWQTDDAPVSDGGEGLLDCFGGANRRTRVTGPLGDPVEAGWRLDGGRAVIEMARASGLSLVAGRNDPVAATTAGTGELIAAALDAGAREIVVGVGGSATTDGGRGALDVLAARGVARLAMVTVAADVTTRFVAAAEVFAPQKGADDADVARLTARLQHLAGRYLDRYGVAVADLPGSGAAGGLAGGLAALGARIRPGFDVVADQLDLESRVRAADLVLTGEGRLDRTSLDGKAPIGMVRLCRRVGTRVALIVGAREDGIDAGAPVVALTDLVGGEQAFTDPLPAVRRATRQLVTL